MSDERWGVVLLIGIISAIIILRVWAGVTGQWDTRPVADPTDSAQSAGSQ